jgi:hypothetical protein
MPEMITGKKTHRYITEFKVKTVECPCHSVVLLVNIT